MEMIRKIIGPKSKYDTSIPYTYEARVPVIGVDNEFNYYISDTICGLIDHLIRNGIGPDEAEIYEIYREKETQIDRNLYSSENNWLRKPELCNSFREHYAGHISDHGCSFEDRG